MRIRAIVIFAAATLLSQPALYAENFKDVPKDHWAAESVEMVAADGVMKGYPDATFKGEKTVTRYELAVALERMIDFIQQSLEKEVKSPKSKVKSSKAPSTHASSRAEQVHDSAQFLKSEGYIAANSPLLTDRNKSVSPTELAQALSSVAAKLIQKTIPPPRD